MIGNSAVDLYFWHLLQLNHQAGPSFESPAATASHAFRLRLRYPSRFPPRSIKNLRLGSARSASLPAEPRARGTGHRAQGVPWEPRTAGRAERQVNEPVAKEARWSWEEQPGVSAGHGMNQLKSQWCNHC